VLIYDRYVSSRARIAAMRLLAKRTIIPEAWLVAAERRRRRRMMKPFLYAFAATVTFILLAALFAQ